MPSRKTGASALAAQIMLIGWTGCGAVQEKLNANTQMWQSDAMQQRREMCAADNGRFGDVDVQACTDGTATVTADGTTQQQPCTGGEAARYQGQCIHRDADDRMYFNDGPTVPDAFLQVGEDLGEGVDLMWWNGFFWRAAVNHDYCYHHGGPTYQYSQADCDNQMLDDLVALCSQPAAPDTPWLTRDRCSANAQIMYASVRAFGDANYGRVATVVHYPPFAPLWRALGLPQAPEDPALRDAIDSTL